MTTSTPTSLLGRLLNGATTLSRIAIWIAGGLTLLSAIYITLDVLSRKFLNSPLGGSDELSGYAFAISVSWALSFATLDRANIRIDAIYQHLPVRIAAFLDWVALVALAVFIVYLTRYAAEVAGMSWESQSTANTILGTPLWIPQTLWAAGLVWLCVVLALMLIRASLALVTGNMAEVQRICGIRTTKEEASAEAESGKRLVQMEQQS
ncbi:MAG: TRAP transporter small permease [Alcaligenaceae bacterium]|uniref:TRAP transporter small permease protein n=1 Tax=Paenalcaligenes hermetiae TaxID=1157987 RepID=A0ABP9LXA3_9BURK|nr:TRAP transporter small permease [Alcaligenaceae bacterium]